MGNTGPDLPICPLVGANRLKICGLRAWRFESAHGYQDLEHRIDQWSLTNRRLQDEYPTLPMH